MNFNSIIFDVIYSFHMPLFFFVSGFCGVKVLDMIQRKQKIQYISSRFMRLMIPYYFVGFIYVPLKLFLCSEVRGKVNIKTLPLDFISGNNPNYQLWTFQLTGVICCVISTLLGVGLPILVSKILLRRVKILKRLVLGESDR